MIPSGTCYIHNNANTIYAFPDLTCNEGSLLPSFTSTTRQTYYLYDGKAVYSSRTTVNNTGGSYSQYIAHVATGDRFQFVPLGYTLIAAVLIVLAFFGIIFNWFKRLR